MSKKGIDEARNVVVLLARGGGHQAVHQLKAQERKEADPPDHQDAIEYRV
jgi:hypothetical protein